MLSWTEMGDNERQNKEVLVRLSVLATDQADQAKPPQAGGQDLAPSSRPDQSTSQITKQGTSWTGAGHFNGYH